MKVSIVNCLVISQSLILQYQWDANVGCPFIGRTFDNNWGIEDTTGKSEDEFKVVIEQIRQNILKLRSEMNLA